MFRFVKATTMLRLSKTTTQGARIMSPQKRWLSTPDEKLRDEGTLAILGGVGPLAGVKFQEKVITNTIAACDHDHLEIVHFCRPEDITPRDTFLPGQVLDTDVENPANGMLRSVRFLADYSRSMKRDVVIGIPCITFHTPAIWEVFVSGVDAYNQNAYEDNDCENRLTVFHLVDETVAMVRNNFPHVEKIGVLSTLTTRKSKLVSQPFKDLGMEVLEVSMDKQRTLSNIIHHPNLGLKTMYPPHYRVREVMEECIIQLKEMGSELVVLGCSELPIVVHEQMLYGVPLIDPTLVLAREMIREANPKKLTEDCPFLKTLASFSAVRDMLNGHQINGVHHR